MSKRAGKSGLCKRYKGHTYGPGGLKCPCCGGEPSRKVRKAEKREAAKEIEEQARENDIDQLYLDMLRKAGLLPEEKEEG